MANTYSKISNLINTQAPFFVRNDHQNFISFVEAYYEYMEQEGKAVERLKNIPRYRDIDESIDVFADKMYDNFIALVPDNTIVDKNMLVKKAKDFYRARGTEKSINFLTRILFGEESTFYYPKKDILRVSDGKWYVEKSLKVSNVKVDGIANNDLLIINNFENKRIVGSTSNASAIVEKVDVYFDRASRVEELKITAQERDFISGEEVFVTFEEEGITKTLSAQVFSGIVNSVRLIEGGSGYQVGSLVPVESDTGSGAIVQISGATTGNLRTAIVTYTGAGFQNGSPVLITGGGGSGATANVLFVTPDGAKHPNSYNIVTSTISLESNTALNNTVYSNLNSSNSNTQIANAYSYFIYNNTGPVDRIAIISGGSGYTSLPSLDIQSDIRIRNLGILGRMDIVDGGINYQANDNIIFVNVPGGFGSGAQARVKSVDVNGSITAVEFVGMPGEIIGGTGYDQSKLPLAQVISNTGSNASIITTAVLGDGESLIAVTDSIGKITQLSLVSGGRGYTEPPTINLQSIGDGTAVANATVISGIFSYPGRYINDDGIISGFNFIQNRDYYQNYSYVVRVKESINKYRKALKDLIHPAGFRLFGEYLFESEDFIGLNELEVVDSSYEIL
jgi:hypothetical protein